MNLNMQTFAFVIVIAVFVNFRSWCRAEQDERKFRMQKLNLVWEKASKKLGEEKLKLLYTDLKYQDKEELNLKKLRVEGRDKDGSKEAFVRGSFNAILMKYDLLEDFTTLHHDPLPDDGKPEFMPSPYAKSVFKDKKLNKLWLKAEQQGFTEEQLKMLKQEFEHHQRKIDEYYQIMEIMDKGPVEKDDHSNSLTHVLEAEESDKKWKTEGSPHQTLKEKHSELKSNYDHLTSKIIPSYRNMEFEEPQVNSLWEMAKNASFTEDELESLRRELHHFEHRIRKYKQLSEMELNRENENNIVDEEVAKRQKRIKEYEYKVSKIKTELSDRITARHSEL